MDKQASSNRDALPWVLVGPTASGKTAVALELARVEPVEIVSVDSMQVYRGMDVGTAKPSATERARVVHHMVDVLEPEDPCSVGWFSRMAREAMAGIQARGGRPLLTGGSPLYIKGIIWGLAEGPPRDAGLRRRLTREGRQKGGQILHERLAQVDPASAERIHPNDIHRLVRALEVWELTERPMGGRPDSFDGRPEMAHVMVGLRRPRGELYARIDRRVDAMTAAGLLDEVRSLQGRLGPQARHALGYKELSACLAGEFDLDEAVRLIKRNTRRLARHQLTWYGHFPQVEWLDATEGEDAASLAGRCHKTFRRLRMLDTP